MNVKNPIRSFGLRLAWFLLFLFASGLLLSCSHRFKNPEDPALNLSPSASSNPYPADGATNQGVNVTLGWSCSDPNLGDTLMYDVYLGTSNPPVTAVASNQAAQSFTPSSLNFNTTYFWRIVARDNHGAATSGPVWRFVTGQVPNDPPNLPSNPSPTDGAVNQPISLTLSWTGGDPNSGDTVRYDIYFDTLSPPQQLVSGNQLGTSLPRSSLSYFRNYYWKVVAKDNRGAQTQGPIWRFTTRQNPWATKAPMPTARTDFGAAVVNSKIYAIGGNSAALPTVEEYDPSTNQWATKAPMPTGRNGLAVGVVNNKIYAIGGYNAGYLTTVEEYDPSTDTWTTKSPMPTGRWRLAAGVVNSKIYAIGGENAGGALTTVEEYNPSTDSWTAKSPMPTPRAWLGVGVVANQLYAIGGWRATGVYLSTVEMYDPASNSWTAKASKPTARGGLGADAVNNKVYAFGGEGGVGVHTEVEAYDPSTNSWTTKTSMPTARTGLSVCTVPLNSKIYAIGGWNGTNPLSVVEEYDPSLDP